jgi:arsenate reductase
MAEAIVNARMAESWQAFSAGTKPAGFTHPLAVRALAEIGIEHTGRSKHADEFRGVDFDAVITVCDDAAENCPVWLGKGRRAHIGFDDPARAAGAEDERLAAFRRVRDEIALKIPQYLEGLVF